jgi:hypothetical protein
VVECLQSKIEALSSDDSTAGGKEYFDKFWNLMVSFVGLGRKSTCKLPLYYIRDKY